MNSKLFNIIIFNSAILIGCSTTYFHPIRWDKTEFKNYKYKYVYWKEGVQFVEMSIDDIVVIASGYLTLNYNAYFLISIYNGGDEKFTYYPSYSKLSLNDKEFYPLRPNYIREIMEEQANLATIGYFANVLSSALSASFSKNLNSYSYYENKIEIAGYRFAEQLRNLNAEKNDLIDLLLKNNELLPKETYTGFLLFGKIYDRKNPFDLIIKIGKYKFLLRGKFMDGDKFDEYDLPEKIELIKFD